VLLVGANQLVEAALQELAPGREGDVVLVKEARKVPVDLEGLALAELAVNAFAHARLHGR